MGSRFLTGGSQLSLSALQDGTFDASLRSLALPLIPNYPVCSDITRTLISRQITQNDCDFRTITALADAGAGVPVYKHTTPLGTAVLRTLVAGAGVTIRINTESGSEDEIVIAAGGSGVETLRNVGSGAGVWRDTTGGTSSLKSVVAGTGMTISSEEDDITISTNALTFLQNTGTGEPIASIGVANSANIKSLSAGEGIMISSLAEADDITISTSALTFLQNTGTGVTIASMGVANLANIKSLSSGTGISVALSSEANEIVISTGAVTFVENTGTGAVIASLGLANTANFKSLVAGEGVLLTSEADEITIGTSALTNLQNTGSGVTIASMGVANAANIKSLSAGTGISVSLSSGANEIVISATESPRTSGILASGSGLVSVVTSTNIITELAVAPIIMNNSFIPSSWLVAGATFEFCIAGGVQYSVIDYIANIDLRLTGNGGTVAVCSIQLKSLSAGAVQAYECTYILQITSFNSSTGVLIFNTTRKCITGLTATTVSNATINVNTAYNQTITLAPPYTQLPWFISGNPNGVLLMLWQRHTLTVKQIA